MQPFLVYNWKTYISSRDVASSLLRSLSPSSSVTQIICPSAVHLSFISSQLRSKLLHLGAQDIATSSESPHTGRSSGDQLVAIGVEYVLIGHAETRATGVTNASVLKKIHHALSSSLIPIICLSSPGSDHEHSMTATIAHLEEICRSLSNTSPFLLAYEPTAHIGADHALSPHAVSRSFQQIRSTLTSFSLSAPLLYGGAVTPSNASELFREGTADGFLLGRASVDAEAVRQILQLL